jgi:hypothetical protein
VDRSAQLLNLSALAADAGISHVTARSWTSVLEASFVDCCATSSASDARSSCASTRRGAPALRQAVVYGGATRQQHSHATVLPWPEIDRYAWVS